MNKPNESLMNTKNDSAIACSQLPEHCGLQEIYETLMSHYLRLAKSQGWKEYVWNEVKSIDADTSGLFRGFKQDFLTRVKAIK